LKRGSFKHDLSGRVFGRLTVLSIGPRKGFHQQWLCKCECGTVRVFRAHRLVRGRTKSCGCYGAEIRRRIATKHGQYKTKVYAIWRAMIDRCGNRKRLDYGRYGGRGIRVCPLWKNSLDAFKQWAEESGFSPGLIIDRRNNDRGYTPNNCRWVTPKISNRNTRQNRIIMFKRRKRCVAEWAEITGLPPKVLYNRLDAGWSDERTLTTPLRGQRRPSRNG
jgi:hypothetical protein